MDRRDFLRFFGLGAASIGLYSAFPGSSFAASLQREAAKSTAIKPISGSWFEFNHPGGKEGVNWDGDLKKFTAQMWRDKIFEIRETGISCSHEYGHMRKGLL